MGVRFRKSVSLGKGARVNFSKGGASLSVGRRGASVSVGKRGVYSNVGIPGTGLSVRTRLDKPKSSARATKQSSSQTSSKSVSPALVRHASSSGDLSIDVSVDDLGEIKFSFADTKESIDDPQLIRELKRFQEVKDKIAALQVEQAETRQRVQDELADESASFIEIYRQSPEVVPSGRFEELLSELAPLRYDKRAFGKPRPGDEAIDQAVHKEALENVSGFFGKKRKVAEYEAANRQRVAEEMVASWERERASFEEKEAAREKEANEGYEVAFLAEKKGLERALSDLPEVVEEIVGDWLLALEIPAETDAQIAFDDGTLWIDLDLPEIEDLPAKTAKQLKSGQVKVVDKTKKQLKQEYAACVTGLAFFIISNAFNLSAAIDKVIVSGYTQRRNKDGDMVDDYVYSICVPRDGLVGKAIEDPISMFDEFESRIKLSSSFALGTIKPFENE